MYFNIENKTENVLRLGGGVKLLQGDNSVIKEAWIVCRADRHTRELLDRDLLEATLVKDEPIKDEPAEDATLPYGEAIEIVGVPSISKMSAKDAKEWIAECDDPKILSILIGTDDRSTIVKAVDDRLIELELEDEG